MHRDAGAVHALLTRIGPIQAQTARAPFLAVAARMPGVTLATITSAYEELLIVRGSNLRGTVHTCAREEHAVLEAVTRLGQRTLWARMLKLRATTLEQVWDSLEHFAREEWRTPDELLAHLRRWLDQHDPAAAPRLTSTAGRYLGYGHGGLIRRPLTGGWQSQTAPGYRTAAALLGSRDAVLSDPEAAVDAVVRKHLSAYGPASRHDVAWWSGLGLRTVDAALARLTAELTSQDGPDRRSYHDLTAVPPPSEPPSVRLLPEFDALLCGYDPGARARFVSPEHYRRLWSPDNGMLLAPLLSGGRLTGYWRLPGSGTRRSCEVSWFAGTHRPTKPELEAPLAAVQTAYDVTITGLSISRE